VGTQIPASAHARHQVRDQVGARRGVSLPGEICDRGDALRGCDLGCWLSENPEREDSRTALSTSPLADVRCPHAAGAKDVCARLLVGRSQRVDERPAR
jgi:hypothetical protein